MDSIRIALIGDYNGSVTAHIAIPRALELAGKALDVNIEPVWIGTATLKGPEEVRALCIYHGIWCVPASPYANTDGALSAISLARTHGIPFLGTCGGFQHAMMEFFTNVLGVAQAEHAELNPEAERPLISRLSCSLVEVTSPIRFAPGSLSEKLYGTDRAEETYRCNYGLNPEFRQLLQDRTDLLIEGTDDAGEIRIVRLVRHPYYVATLFQPERSALDGRVHPLIREFVSACGRRDGRFRG